MNNTNLKIIAIVSMLIDHTGAVLFPDLIILRIIGRLAFPIFCFLIVEGYFHTRDLKKYITRLLIFGCVAEIPFDLAFMRAPLEFTYQNVFFTLAFGLMAVHLYDKKATTTLHIGGALALSGVVVMIKMAMDGSVSRTLLFTAPLALIVLMLGAYIFRDRRGKWLDIGGILAACVFATAFTSDYYFIGILIIFYMYHNHGDFKGMAVFLTIMSLVFALMPLMDQLSSGEFDFRAYNQAFMIFALIPIYFYNGKKGPSLKYIFYAFYPVHLLILTLIQRVTPLG